MACYTMTRITLDDTAVNRKARKKLGLPEEGPLSRSDAARVKVEAGVLQTMATMRRLDPTAVIRRKGNTLTVSVNR